MGPPVKEVDGHTCTEYGPMKEPQNPEAFDERPYLALSTDILRTEPGDAYEEPLGTVLIDYREGNGRFNLSHIGDLAKRHNESLDLWYEVEADVRDALKALDNL